MNQNNQNGTVTTCGQIAVISGGTLREKTNTRRKEIATTTNRLKYIIYDIRPKISKKSVLVSPQLNKIFILFS